MIRPIDRPQVPAGVQEVAADPDLILAQNEDISVSVVTSSAIEE
jgi:hypothetical protein